MDLPPEVQSFVDAVSRLPGVAKCYCGPKPLSDLQTRDLSLPGEYGDYPQAIILRTDGGRTNEVMIQTEVILDRSSQAWLTLEFLAWWVKDLGRSGHEIQMRPTALPPKAYEIQLGRTLKFCIEYFVIEDGNSYDRTLRAAGRLGASLADSFSLYRECFEKPANYDEENQRT